MGANKLHRLYWIKTHLSPIGFTKFPWLNNNFKGIKNNRKVFYGWQENNRCVSSCHVDPLINKSLIFTTQWAKEGMHKANECITEEAKLRLLHCQVNTYNVGWYLQPIPFNIGAIIRNWWETDCSSLKWKNKCKLVCTNKKSPLLLPMT